MSKRVTDCINPFTLTTGDLVPCGKCMHCKIRHASQWSFRITQEEKQCSSAWFVTLTYRSESMPYTKNGLRTLRYSDIQKFLKRIRKRQDEKIKYFVVGEYGKKRNRPHWHLIMFNVENIDYVIQEWEHGNPYFGSCTGSSVGYVLKYMFKPVKYRYYKNDDREPSKARMSKGLGESYVTKNMENWHKAKLTERLYCNAPGAQKVSMPRYYRNKIYTDQEREIILEHIRNTKFAHPFKRALIEKKPEIWQKLYKEFQELQEKLVNNYSQKNETL